MRNSSSNTRTANEDALKSNKPAVAWRRHFLGVCSIALLVGWVVLMSKGELDASASAMAGACLRLGMLLAAIWLAWPQIADITARVPLWVMGMVAACLVVAVWRPRLIPIVLPVLLALWALHWMGWLLRPK